MFLLAALALAADPQAAAPVAPKPAAPAKSKMVCVENIPLGSRIPGKPICRSTVDWEAERRDNRDELERSQRLNTIQSPPASNFPGSGGG